MYMYVYTHKLYNGLVHNVHNVHAHVHVWYNGMDVWYNGMDGMDVYGIHPCQHYTGMHPLVKSLSAEAV